MAEAPRLAESACLAAVALGAEHGWAVGTLLAPDGELGRIWSLSRPLTYRAVDGLITEGRLRRRGTAPGRGRDRLLVALTAAGRRTLDAWLDEPVAHLRDVRTELLLKLEVRGRLGRDLPTLLLAQRAAFDVLIDELVAAGPDDGPVEQWRREQARAVRRFLEHAVRPGPTASLDPDVRRLRLSARNQLAGTVSGVDHGAVMSTVAVTMPDGQTVTASVTKDAVHDLDLVAGDAVVAVIKSTDVLVAKLG